MNELVHTAVFQCYAVSAAVLTLNLVVLAGSTAAARGKAGGVLNAEDKGLNAKAEVITVEHETTARWQRAHRNALENIPVYLVLGLILALTQPSATLANALFITFTVARLGHSFFYVKGVQPFRTLCFAIGLLSMVGIAILGAARTFMG